MTLDMEQIPRKSARGLPRATRDDGHGPSLRRHRARYADGVFGIDQVVACQGHGVLAEGDLDLEDHLIHIAEGHFAAGEVEVPHPAETIVVARHLLDLFA